MIVSWVLTAIAIAVSAYIALRGRERKTIDWHVRNYVTLTNPEATSKVADLQVTYKEETLKRPGVLVIRVENTGNREVRSDAFPRPLRISFKHSRPIAASFADASDDDLIGVSFDPIGSAVDVPMPKVLNRGEWFDVRLLVEGEYELPVVSGRFEGQRRPVGVKDAAKRKLYMWGAAASFLTALSLIAYAYSQREPGAVDLPAKTVLAILGAAVSITTALTLASSASALQRERR